MKYFYPFLVVMFGWLTSAQGQTVYRDIPNKTQVSDLQEVRCVTPVRMLKDPGKFFERDYFYQKRPELWINAHFNNCQYQISVYQEAKNMSCSVDPRFLSIIPYKYGDLIPYFGDNAKLCVVRKTTEDDKDRFYKRGKYAPKVTPSDEF